MSVRTKQLAIGDTGTDDDVVVYTCPEGRTAIVKDIAVLNITGAAETLTVSVAGDTTYHAFVMWESVLSGTVLTLQNRFIVLEPGDELHVATFAAHAAGEIRYIVSGTELDGVA